MSLIYVAVKAKLASKADYCFFTIITLPVMGLQGETAAKFIAVCDLRGDSDAGVTNYHPSIGLM